MINIFWLTTFPFCLFLGLNFLYPQSVWSDNLTAAEEKKLKIQVQELSRRVQQLEADRQRTPPPKLKTEDYQGKNTLEMVKTKNSETLGAEEMTPEKRQEIMNTLKDLQEKSKANQKDLEELMKND